MFSETLSSPFLLVSTWVCCVSLLFVLKLRLSGRSHSVPYPPGPKSCIIPTRNAWMKYQEWGKEYGDLIYIHEGKLLIVNSLSGSLDLLEKRARIYSSRSFSEMTRLSGADIMLGFMPYSERWRKLRRTLHQNFRADAAQQFRPTQYEKVHKLLGDLITRPEDFQSHTMSLSKGVVSSALYGLDFSAVDRLVQITDRTSQLLARVLIPGEFPTIEMYPWLRFLPSWLPGWRFQRIAAKCRAQIEEMHNVPFNMTLDNQKAGAGSSLVAELAKKNEANLEEFERIRCMGTISYLAAIDTTTASINSFLLAMTLHQDIQAKGQEELDRVVGRDRLPTFEDRKSLPYVEAIYQEVMRLYPPVPLCEYHPRSFSFIALIFCGCTTLAIAHKSTEDDYYRGFYIPKGCTVVPNIWAMNRDESHFKKPNEFYPERFLNSPEGPFRRINDITAYGFGRRVCVGRYMADATVWLAIASVLATLTVGKAKDDKGREIDIVEEYTDEFFFLPKPHRCSITPRSKQTEMLIRDAASSDPA